MKAARGHVFVVATALFGAAGVGALVVSTSLPSHNSVASPDHRMILAAAHIDPDGLAASGVTANQAGAVATNAVRHVTSADLTLEAGFHSLVALRGQTIAAERAVRSGQGSADDLGTLRTQLAAQEANVDLRMQQLRAAAYDGLSVDQHSRLETLRTGSTHGLHYPYCAMDGVSERDGVELRNALSAVRTCSNAGVSPDSSDNATVSTADGRTDVSIADAGLRNKEAIRIAFRTALGG